MTSTTHISFAELFYLVLLTTAGLALTPVNALLIALGSLLPDLDNTSTRIGRLLPFVSRFLERRFGHRTITHSAIVLFALSVPAFLLPSPYSVFWLCVFSGYASHPFLDTMTVNGVQLFYPFSTSKCVFPLEVNNPHRYRVQTGSRTDRAIGIMLGLLCIPAFVIANQGYERFVRTTQKNITSAVRDYNEFSRNSTVFAEISGYDLLTKEHIKGEFEVIGSLDEETLVFEGPDGQAHTLGKEYRASYKAEEILCHPGQPVETVIRSLDMSNQPLGQVRLYLDSAGEHHLFGILWTDDQVSIPRDAREFAPVLNMAGSLRFNYATLRDIDRYAIDRVHITRGILTVRTLIPRPPGGNDAARPSASDIGPVSYSQVRFEATDRVRILVRVGDTVSVGTLLALRESGSGLDEQRALLLVRLASLDREYEVRASDLRSRIQKADNELRRDSLSLQHSRRLRDEAFSSGAGEEKIVAALQAGRARRTALLALIVSQGKKHRLQELKLRTEVGRIDEQSRPEPGRDEIRSTAAGTITDIRQQVFKSKTQYSFIVRNNRGM